MSKERSFSPLVAMVVVAGMGLLAGLGWIGWRVKRGPGTLAGLQAGAPEPQRTHSAGARSPGCRFIPGQELSYEVVSKTELKLDLARLKLPAGAEVKGPPPVRTVEVTLDTKALPADGKPGTVLLARYGKVDEGTTREAGVITAPFLLRVDPACKMVGFARLDTTAVGQARTQQAIAYELQWTWPASGRGEADGENTIGRFRALYEQLDAGGRPAIRRKILGFTELWGDSLPGAPTPAGPKTPRSSAMTVDVGPGPWFASLQGQEEIAGFTIVDVTSRVTARQVPTAPAAFAELPTEQSRYIWEDLLGQPTPVGPKQRHSRGELQQMEELRKLTLKQVLARYQEMLDRKENISRRWPMLALYLEARPELIGKYAEMLHRNELEDYMEPDMYLALGKVPGTAARDALLAINADKSASAIDRTRAAFAIIDREDVGVDFARTLHSDSRGVGRGKSYGERIYAREAVLALGTMAGLRGQAAPEIKSVAREAALDLLKAGRDDVTLAPAFAAIGNIGDPDLLAEVVPYTHRKNPSIRAEAAVAIRRMPPEQTMDTTLEWLRREPSATVKEQVYYSLVQQLAGAGKPASPALLAQAMADLATTPNAATRQSLYKIIGPAATTDANAKAALIGQVRHEMQASEGLSTLLGEYLSGPEIQQGLHGR